MASKGMRIDGCFLMCTECKKEYDIASISLDAKKKRKRNLYCPHCGHRIGTLN